MKKIAIFSLSILLIYLFFSTPAVFAQAKEECTASYSGSQWMTLDCSPGFSTPHDRIRIFRRAGLDPARPWQENLDFTESTWIFEAGAKERASLIIDFHHTADGLTADLYEDGDGQVNYELQENRPVVSENHGNWSLRVIAKDGWWTQGDLVNYNLDLLVDSRMYTAYTSRDYLVEAVQTDGRPDYEIHVRDLDRDGRPDYEWRQNRYPLPEDPQLSGQIRTEIVANTEDDEPAFPEGVFWPFLSREIGNYNRDRPGLPPIQVDWQKAAIVQVAEFIRARSDPGSFSIYSKERVHEGQTNTTDFENPIAFYDLAQAGDGYSDLNLRFGVTMPYSPLTDYWNTTPLNDIQYVWDQTHTQHWDYQVNLAGRQVIDEVIQFPEFSVRAVPYAKLPEWVTAQAWDVATFVQVEKSPYYNSEIVWAWYTWNGSGAVYRKYLPGITDIPPYEDFAEIETGLRGEYAFEYNSKPLLYFSPVDRKLHLLKAQGGIYRLDDQHVIRYQNLGGEYINQWTLLENEQPLQSLFFDSGYLVYQDAASVRLTRLAAPPALFTTLPPRNHAEWVNLGAALEQNKPTFAPDDFKAMAAQFGEATSSIEGASMRGLRLTGSGFRFIINLQDGFSSNREDLLGITGTAPGEYAVSYDGSFHVQPLTEVDLQLSFPAVQPAAYTPREFFPNNLQVLLHNAGLEDALQVQAILGMSQPGQEVTWTEAQTVTVLGGETATLLFPWTPLSSGEWQLQARARVLDPKISFNSQATAEQVIEVQEAQATSLQQQVGAFGAVEAWQVAVLIAAIMAAAAMTAWALLRLLAGEPRRKDA